MKTGRIKQRVVAQRDNRYFQDNVNNLLNEGYLVIDLKISDEFMVAVLEKLEENKIEQQ
jgi:UDP-galactopyranose mutase